MQYGERKEYVAGLEENGKRILVVNETNIERSTTIKQTPEIEKYYRENSRQIKTKKCENIYSFSKRNRVQPCPLRQSEHPIKLTCKHGNWCKSKVYQNLYGVCENCNVFLEAGRCFPKIHGLQCS